jgi:D-amino peptidase
MKILIAADMEGITGVVQWDQVKPSHPEYQRFRRLMTEDVNAAIRGAFAGGATSVAVTDGHNNGKNILIEELDPRASLNSGQMSSPLSMVHGADQGVSGVIYIGYHARSGSKDAALDHTWTEEITGVWINDQVFGEAGLNGGVCGQYDVPVIMASGDQTLCAEVKALFGDRVEAVQVKKAVGRFSAECLPPAVTTRLIEEAAARAVANLAAHQAPEPLKIAGPIKMKVVFTQSDMADRAALLPHAIRTVDRCVEYVADDMVTIYRAFRVMASLAG